MCLPWKSKKQNFMSEKVQNLGFQKMQLAQKTSDTLRFVLCIILSFLSFEWNFIYRKLKFFLIFLSSYDDFNFKSTSRSVKGRLSASTDFWKTTLNAPKFVPDTIRLPLSQNIRWYKKILDFRPTTANDFGCRQQKRIYSEYPPSCFLASILNLWCKPSLTFSPMVALLNTVFHYFVLTPCHLLKGRSWA